MKYSLDNCNIVNCNKKAYKLFLCQEHYDQYIIDEKIARIQSMLYAEQRRTLTLRDKIDLYTSRVFHGVFFLRTYFIEHFPLESLFLYHYNYQTKRLFREKDRKDARDKLFKLTQDFAYNNHPYILKIKYMLTVVDKKLSTNNLEEITLSDLIKGLIAFTPSSFLFRTFILLLAILAVGVLSNARQVIIQIFFNLNFYYVTLGLFVLSGAVYYILKFIYSIDPLINQAFSKTLFEKQEDNVHFLSQFQYAKSALTGTIEFLKTYRFWVVLSWLYSSFKIISKSHLNYIEIIVSLIINLLLINLLFRLFSVYPVYSRISPQIWRMPKKHFFIDIYNLDRRSNVGALIDTNNYYIMSNLYIIIFIWFLIAALHLYSIVYIIFALLITLLRLISLEHSYSLYKNIKCEIRDSINNEANNLDKLSFAEKQEKYEFISRLKTYPILSDRFKRISLGLIGYVAIPFLFLLLDKHYSFIEKLIVLIRNMLFNIK